MSMIRGLDYYTGNIFEICQEGSLTITAGGRYDNMIENFGGRPTPAVGISLGVDRLVNFLQLDLGKTKVKVFVANVNEKAKARSVELAKELREIGVNVEYDVSGRGLSKQFEYANSKGIKFVIVLGEKEIKSGVFKLRNMESGAEKDIEFRNLRRVLDIVSSD
jgi:histidyl-tRNA synthetase